MNLQFIQLQILRPMEIKTPIKHHMIESMDDLVKIANMIKENTNEQDKEDDDKNKRDITYIVHKYDDKKIYYGICIPNISLKSNIKHQE